MSIESFFKEHESDITQSLYVQACKNDDVEIIKTMIKSINSDSLDSYVKKLFDCAFKWKSYRIIHYLIGCINSQMPKYIHLQYINVDYLFCHKCGSFGLQLLMETFLKGVHPFRTLARHYDMLCLRSRTRDNLLHILIAEAILSSNIKSFMKIKVSKRGSSEPYKISNYRQYSNNLNDFLEKNSKEIVLSYIFGIPTFINAEFIGSLIREIKKIHFLNEEISSDFANGSCMRYFNKNKLRYLNELNMLIGNKTKYCICLESYGFAKLFSDSGDIPIPINTLKKRYSFYD